MKKLLLVLSMLGLVGSASAQEIIKNASDGFGVFAGVSAGKTAGESSTGFAVGGDYTKYLDSHFFVKPSILYIDSQTDFKDKHTVGLVDVGYTFILENGLTVSPKAGLGYRHTKFDGGSDGGSAFNVGVDVGIATNWNAGLNFVRMKGENGKHADYTILSVGYRF